MASGCNPTLLSLGPDLLERIASFVPHNDIAAGLRPACKAFTQTYRGRYAKVLLSEPISHQLFEERWGSPEAWRGVPHNQRVRLVSKVAASGVVENLKLAVQRAHCKLGYEPLKSAARAGRLESCRWLLANMHAGEPLDLPAVLDSAVSGGSIDICKLFLDAANAGGTADGPVLDASLAGSGVLPSAAAAGRKELAAWLWDNGATWNPAAPGFAARNGHWELAEWLLELHKESPATWPVCYEQLTYGAAAGCDLSALQRALALELANAPPLPDDEVADFIDDPKDAVGDMLAWMYNPVTAAATSMTPDWQAKVIWLTSPAPDGAGLEPVCDDSVWYRLPEYEALDRVQWLLASACVKVSPSCHTAERCAAQGSTACLQKLAELGVPFREGAALRAVESGHIAVLQLLKEHGCPMPPRWLMCEAARAGQLGVLQWLVGALGPEGLLPWGEGEGVLGRAFGGRGSYAGKAPARNLVEVAVAAGHLTVAEWLVQAVEGQLRAQQQQAAAGGEGGQQVLSTQGQEGGDSVEISQHLMTGAALSGRLDVVCWLHGRGCALDGGVAVRAGNVELVEWLASQGCLMSVSGPWGGRRSTVARNKCGGQSGWYWSELQPRLQLPVHPAWLEGCIRRHVCLATPATSNQTTAQHWLSMGAVYPV